MADKIYMDTQLLEQLSAQITQLKNSLNTVKGSVSSSLSEVRRVASSQTGIINKLSNTQRNLGNTIEHANRLARATKNAANLWTETEERIANQNLGVYDTSNGEGGAAGGYNAQAVAEAIRKSLGYPKDTSKWTKEMWDKYNKIAQNALVYQNSDGDTVIASDDQYIIIGSGAITVVDMSSGFLSGTLSATTYGEDGSYFKEEISLKADKKGWDGKLLVKDKDGNYKPVKLKPKEKPIIKDKAYETSRIGTIFQYGIAHSIEGAALHGEISGSNGWAEGSAHYNVSHGEAKASLYAGLYATKVDDNGNVHYSFEPGIDAKLGASYSLFDAEASGQIGGDNLNINGKASVSVGKVGAEAEAQLGFVDGKPAARVSGKLEAIAAEAKGEVGVNVAGIEGTVKGSVNVGIGAHADVGFHDGKISCDVGLSFGIGGSVSIEVDVGGFVDNVASFAGDVADGVGDVLQGASDFIGSLLPW